MFVVTIRARNRSVWMCGVERPNDVRVAGMQGMLLGMQMVFVFAV